MSRICAGKSIYRGLEFCAPGVAKSIYIVAYIPRGDILTTFDNHIRI
jgi:hypothetical protein